MAIIKKLNSRWTTQSDIHDDRKTHAKKLNSVADKMLRIMVAITPIRPVGQSVTRMEMQEMVTHLVRAYRLNPCRTWLSKFKLEFEFNTYWVASTRQLSWEIVKFTSFNWSAVP